MANFYVWFLFLIVCIGCCSRRNLKIFAHLKENNCSMVICFVFWLVGLQLNKTCVILDHKIPSETSIKCHSRLFSAKWGRSLEQRVAAVCDLFTGQLVCELELKVKRTAPVGLFPTLLGPNSTNPACCKGKESTPKPFYKCHFWLWICLFN